MSGDSDRTSRVVDLSFSIDVPSAVKKDLEPQDGQYVVHKSSLGLRKFPRSPDAFSRQDGKEHLGTVYDY